VKAKLEQLTPREREVVLLVAEGMTNAEIAEKCVISQGTVKTHMKRIIAKLELRDRAQVVVYAYEAGVVSPRAAMQHRSMTGF
jgi:DNA-binding NarL/FixJ family response regulator